MIVSRYGMVSYLLSEVDGCIKVYYGYDDEDAIYCASMPACESFEEFEDMLDYWIFEDCVDWFRDENRFLPF